MLWPAWWGHGGCGDRKCPLPVLHVIPLLSRHETGGRLLPRASEGYMEERTHRCHCPSVRTKCGLWVLHLPLST